MTAVRIISNHDQLAGLNDDDHSQYFHLPGRAGGQVAIGGMQTTELLTLQDNAVDANQITFGLGLSAGLLDATGHDIKARHIGLGVNAPSDGHLILGAELFTGTGNKVGMGIFPVYVSSGTGNLYGVQGNVFFGGNLWGAGSTINALQFYPAPDYQYGSVAWGNANLNLIGITTGGMINIFGRAVTANDLIGISTQTLAHIFGAPGVVSANRAIGVWVATPSATTGTIGVQTGIRIDPQLYGTVNQGIWLAGDGAGSDLCLGAGSGNNPDARIYYDGSNFIIDPDNLGSGLVYIGTTGDDDMLLNSIEIDGDLNHDGSNAGFFGTAPATQPTALTTALTQITHTGPGTPDYAIATPIDSGVGSAWGFSNQNEFETVMSVVLNLQTRVDELESKLQSLGLLA